jgi:hypothetical protein
MAATREDIRRWLLHAADGGARWVVIKRDGFDNSNYPVALTRSGEVFKAMKGDPTEEVYDLSLSIELQLAEERSWHPPEGTPYVPPSGPS